MKLAVVNGSPRGKKSNSDRIIGWMTDGIEDVTKVYAADIKKHEESVADIQSADTILFIFPLYTDAMPGLTKEFMERMYRKDFSGKKIYFVVHSGFPEAVHSRVVEKYCRYFAKICNMELMGTAVMGGSEALQVAPDGFFGKRWQAFVSLGGNIKKQEAFDESAVKTISGRENFKKFLIFIQKFLPVDMYWNSQLKKNGVFDKRYDRPYL